MELTPDFKEFIELLNEKKVKYLVIGGYAVNYHGYPRFTNDIDLWILMTEENIQKLLSALEDFGFSSLGLKMEDFESPEDVIQLGIAPNRIDLLTGVEGLDFETCYENKKTIKYKDIEISMIGFHDLIIAKKNTGRLQDLADAEHLEKINHKKYP